ncbi:hypothetical protein E3P86_02934 [Wallemia ichthyophaga]|uniref:Cyclin-like domain-containing protein n=1 Tax=Wallemia ichthyophaga TaxID=245174 RepID=A0A4T0IWW0_WALIC|nr:hypothetical protein E3P86_02934 [Wallemia ichthyophaga]
MDSMRENDTGDRKNDMILLDSAEGAGSVDAGDDTHTEHPHPPHQHPLYHDSSQYRHWRFSETALREHRESANAKAIALARAGWEKEEALNAASQSSTSASASTAKTTPPSTDEEDRLIVYYLSQVKPICNLFQFPEVVEASAITYIKRVYLFNSVMDLHPKRVMLTCLFIATKTVNAPVSVADFAKHIGKGKISTSSILDIEFLLSQNLRFEYATHPAHRAAWGVYLDMQSMQTTPQQELDGLFGEVRQLVRLSRLTCAELVYSPSQIALGCFSMANRTLTDAYIEWKRNAFNAQPPPHTAIEGVVHLINTYKSSNTLNKESVQDIDRRLKAWQDPSKVEGTAMHRLKQEEGDKVDLDKRKKRQAEAERNDKDGESVFGGLLGGHITHGT